MTFRNYFLNGFLPHTSIRYLCSYLKEIVIPNVSIRIVDTQVLRHPVVLADAIGDRNRDCLRLVKARDNIEERFEVGMMIVWNEPRTEGLV